MTPPPSFYLKEAMARLHLDADYDIAKDKWAKKADAMCSPGGENPAKPRIVMATWVYLRLAEDLRVRRDQKEVAKAFGISEVSLRACAEKIRPKVLN